MRQGQSATRADLERGLNAYEKAIGKPKLIWRNGSWVIEPWSAEDDPESGGASADAWSMLGDDGKAPQKQ